MLQACYGHTEGAAGTTGLLLAVQSMAQRSAAGIMCLREVNPYVGAAVADWATRAGHGPALPRQLGALCEASLAGGQCANRVAFPKPAEAKALFIVP